MKITRKDYEKHLNDIGTGLPDESFIIGGKYHKNRNKYGQLLRLYDPIGFEVGYQEYIREHEIQNSKR